MRPLLILFAIVLSFTAKARQGNENDGHSHHHRHHHSRNEIGISTGAIYSIDYKTWGPGLHLHYLRTLGDHSPWAVGGFAEQAWVEGGHFSLGAGVNFEPVDALHLGVFPGLTVAKHDAHDHAHDHDHNGKEWKTRFSIHFEVVYDLFTWKNFHLGPAFDYSWSKNDSHMMLGIHAAYCF